VSDHVRLRARAGGCSAYDFHGTGVVIKTSFQAPPPWSNRLIAARECALAVAARGGAGKQLPDSALDYQNSTAQGLNILLQELSRFPLYSCDFFWLVK
jgi:hypothetical protein